jgi:hypothetical protein
VASVIAALDDTAAHLNVHGRTRQLSAVPTGAHLVEIDTPSRV